MASLLAATVVAMLADVNLAPVSAAEIAPPPVPAGYVPLFQAAVDAALKTPPARRQPADRITTALAAWLVADKTGDARYRAHALAELDAFLATPGGRADRDFHVSRPLGLLVLRLHEAGLLAGDLRARLLARAAPLVSWYVESHPLEARFFDCNIALADAVAADCLARSFATEPTVLAARIREMIAALGTRILATGDLDEDASNYSSLGLCFFLELARLEGWLPMVAESDAFRGTFARMRDIISPAGSIPEYGDGYFRAREARLDFVLLLEMAARLYDDGSFQAAADHVSPRTAADLKPDQLLRAFMLLDLEPFVATRSTEPPRAAVLLRRLPGDPERPVPDKLVLRAGPPAAAISMIMIDIYADGSHAHEFKRPSIGFYEVDGVPLFHNLGRRGTRSGQCGNSFWLFQSPERFPGHLRPGEWNTMAVPVDHLFPGQAPGTLRISDGLDFRTFRTPKIRNARFDNLRLEGPAGVLLLDGFESPATWHRNIAARPDARLETSSDRTEGAGSQGVALEVLGEQLATRLFERKEVRGRAFDPADYDVVKLDFAFEGQLPHCNLRRLFDRWVDLGDRPLPCRVAAARAEQVGADAWGEIRFTDYLAPGATLDRTIALTREGGLVVVDSFTPTAGMRGWAAGQLWQLYELDRRGPDWFASASDGAYPQADGSQAERMMLVKFMGGPGVSCGSEQVRPTTMHAPRADGRSRSTYHTTFSRQPVMGGPFVAALAVLPIRPGDDPEPLAARILLEPTGQGARERGVAAVLPTASGSVRIRVGDGPVAFHREPGERAGAVRRDSP
jgi:hypothetical protein